MINYYLYFIIYSFLGWCMETIRFSRREHRFVNRGFLNGPVCPIYGVGMVIILILLKPVYHNVILLFFAGAILASVLEYLTGYVLEKLFYTRWWDYTDKKYNLSGYVCLENTFYWGVLSVFMITFIQPQVNKFLGLFNDNLLNSFSVLTFTIISIDGILTLLSLLHLRQRLHDLQLLNHLINDNPKLKETYVKVHDNLVNEYITLKQYITKVKEMAHLDKTSISKYLDQVELKELRPKKQVNRLLRNYKTSTQSKYNDELSIIKCDLNNKENC